MLRPLVSARFHLLSHSPSGVLFTFPHGNTSLSVAKEYLALRGGPRRFRPGFPCPAVLRNLVRKADRFRLQDRYPLWCGFPSTSANDRLCNFPTRRQPDPRRPYSTTTTRTAAMPSSTLSS